MKKLFLAASAVFALALFSSVNFQNETLVKNSAFAAGTCCPETSSYCLVNGTSYHNYYYKSEGSCKTKKPTIQTIQ